MRPSANHRQKQTRTILALISDLQATNRLDKLGVIHRGMDGLACMKCQALTVLQKRTDCCRTNSLRRRVDCCNFNNVAANAANTI